MPNEDATTEVWKPVVGYEGIYEVSNLGHVRSVRLLCPFKNSYGYACLTLRHKGAKRFVAVHRLVAQAFLGSRPTGLQTNHVNGDKMDPRLANLHYVTARENTLHAVRLGLFPTGKRSGAL